VNKKILKHLFKTFLLALALVIPPMGAHAAGLGQVTVLSALGQPLRAEIELTASPEELSTLTAHLASREAFEQAGVELAPGLSGVKMVVGKGADKKPVIRVTTERVVNDPFLTLLVEVNWSAGRLMRQYTFLLDPAPDVLARKPVAAPPAKSAVAQTAPEASPEQPEAGKPQPEKAPAKTSTKASAKAPAEAKAGEHTVQKGEYLRKIAAETKYDNVSLDQMLVAIFNNNKSAFIGDSMHRLKAGTILSIPDEETVAAVNERQARKTVSAQTADFNAYRQKLAAAAAGTEGHQEGASQAATGKIEAKVEEKTPAPAEGTDVVRISKAEANQINALKEDLAARDQALKEAQSRQAELEKNVADLKALIELKNQNLAELQKQAEASKGASAPAAPPASAASPAAQQTNNPLEAVTPSAPADADKPVAPAPAEAKPAPAPKVEPAPAALPSNPLPAKPGFLEELLDNPLFLLGGLLALILVIWLVYRQSRKKQLEDIEKTTTLSSEVGTSSFGTTRGQNVDTSSNSTVMTDFSQATIGAINADESVDPVAEADVYMAYGRDAQAEEILLDAMKSDPSRAAIHLKLLEIYAGRENLKQFETIASDLYVQTNGAGSDWEKAAAMGRRLDPHNPLFGGVAEAGRSVDTTAPATVLPVDEKPAPEALEVPEVPEMPDDLNLIAEAIGNAGVIPATAASAEPDLDIDLDAEPASVVVEAPIAAAPEVKAEAVETETAATVDALDFNFDLDAPAAPASKPAPQAATAPEFDLSAISLDLDEPVVDEAEVTTKLHLAKAYEEMGDKEGARELLAEVVKEGNAEQQAEAQAMLDKLG